MPSSSSKNLPHVWEPFFLLSPARAVWGWGGDRRGALLADYRDRGRIYLPLEDMARFGVTEVCKRAIYPHVTCGILFQRMPYYDSKGLIVEASDLLLLP